MWCVRIFVFLLCCLCMQAAVKSERQAQRVLVPKEQNREQGKQDFTKKVSMNHNAQSAQILLQNIQSVLNAPQKPLKQTQGAMRCTLTPQEQKLAILTYPSTFYEYYNALLERNRVDMDTSKLTQDLLMESVRHHNTPSMLLALQLHFSKQCERCDKIRDLSAFDYYRDKNAPMQRLLMVEGGSFATSYALLGEAFLCRALTSGQGRDYLMAYSNLMMAGLHTRAINALLQGIATSNDDMLYATLQFLLSFDYVFAKNEAGAYFIRILRVQKKHTFANIMALPHLQNLRVIEYDDVASNAILQALMTRDLEMGRILLPLDRFATEQSIQEFWQKLQHYSQAIKAGNAQILGRANAQELQEYLKIIQLKARLKTIGQYPFALMYQK